MGCDDDNDDADDDIDSEDDFIPFKIGEGEDEVDITEAVLEDVVELKRHQIMTDSKVEEGSATIRVYSPGAENEFGHVRLMKRTDTGLRYCEGNEHSFPVKDIPTDSEPDETYYLQGVTPSVRARDVTVVMEYDVVQHGAYNWFKIVRDVMWVNVVKMDFQDSDANIDTLVGSVEFFPRIDVISPTVGTTVRSDTTVSISGTVRSYAAADSSDALVTVNDSSVTVTDGVFSHTVTPRIEGDQGVIEVTATNMWGLESSEVLRLTVDDVSSGVPLFLPAPISACESAYFVDRGVGNLAARNSMLCVGHKDDEELRAAVRFPDLFGPGPGQVPPGATVTRAMLRLHVVADTALATRNIIIARILDPDDTGDWKRPAEPTGEFGEDDEFESDVGISWVNKDVGIAWQSPGGDASIVDTHTISHKNGAPDIVELDVMPSIEAWISGSPNMGWLVTADGPYVAFHSESSGRGMGPTLFVEYAQE